MKKTGVAKGCKARDSSVMSSGTPNNSDAVVAVVFVLRTLCLASIALCWEEGVEVVIQQRVGLALLVPKSIHVLYYTLC